MARQSKVYQVRSDFDESQNISEDLYAQQVERELNFFSDVNSRQVAGTDAPAEGSLPIRLKVPNAGQIFRFSKLLVQENEPVTLNAWADCHPGALGWTRTDFGRAALLFIAGVGLVVMGDGPSWDFCSFLA